MYSTNLMERKEDLKSSSGEVDNSSKDEFQELLQTLEQRLNWDGQRLIKYNGFWLLEVLFRPMLSAQNNFKAKDTDVILSTMPKSGTTWLKALTFSIANRRLFTIDQSPLLTSSPHTLVPSLEFNVYWEQENPDLSNIPSPRIFATHMPFNILPDSIRESDCKIIYICRNPLDQFVSHRHFLLENKIGKEADPLDVDEAFDMFCQGIHPCGPFWDHMLGYWKAHLENPGKVLFLKYEDLKEDITSQVKKIAEFMVFPFSPEEEEQGLIDHITRLCSFESLSNLAVNNTGNINGLVKNSSFFRKGQVGDWTNYLTPAMAERIKKLMDSKFGNSGLMFKI
ncbi:Cytosolic sulfotransferase 15 [Sesamum alatum]|uniref:Sulfotransferase n=1 Tax=Sesamum alatum TaxID=300844 RepID=A0AAE1Y2N8_9LAMI|nr:Cytosolic sulfotransferase 15 [Sesamum alatum]